MPSHLAKQYLCFIGHACIALSKIYAQSLGIKAPGINPNLINPCMAAPRNSHPNG
jgi:hypothetical protein